MLQPLFNFQGLYQNLLNIYSTNYRIEYRLYRVLCILPVTI